jgi:CubicO group peptidase (beta-lactamase class C family)
MSGKSLEPALVLAEEYHARGVVIMHDGNIIGERYWDGWNAGSNSVISSATKSIVSVLVGMCLTEGTIESLDQPVADFIIKFRAKPRDTVTVRHLLSMTSGLEKPPLWRMRPGVAQNELEFAASLLLQHEPGSTWHYNTIAYRLLFQIIQQASGQTLAAYTRDKLFEPLGMTSSYWRTRQFSNVPSYLNLVCSARDMARFGLLVQQHGNWRGQQLVRRDFIETALQPLQPHNPNFGLLFWLNGPSRRLLPACPADTAIAMGANDTRITIIPSLKLVVSRLGKRFTPPGELMKHEHGNPTGFHNTFMRMICESTDNTSPQ